MTNGVPCQQESMRVMVYHSRSCISIIMTTVSTVGRIPAVLISSLSSLGNVCGSIWGIRIHGGVNSLKESGVLLSKYEPQRLVIFFDTSILSRIQKDADTNSTKKKSRNRHTTKPPMLMIWLPTPLNFCVEMYPQRDFGVVLRRFFCILYLFFDIAY